MRYYNIFSNLFYIPTTIHCNFLIWIEWGEALIFALRKCSLGTRAEERGNEKIKKVCVRKQEGQNPGGLQIWGLLPEKAQESAILCITSWYFSLPWG
jgi:hypothetical protein